MRFTFDSEVWKWEARVESGWYFATVPEPLSTDIREIPRPPRGFGSVRVEVRLGGSTWRTSIFPSGGEYVLPLKQAVRKAEGVELGAIVTLDLEVLG